MLTFLLRNPGSLTGAWGGGGIEKGKAPEQALEVPVSKKVVKRSRKKDKEGASGWGREG